MSDPESEYLNNWRGQPLPWEIDGERSLNKEEKEEIEMYYDQKKFGAAKKARKKAFEAEICRLRNEFEKEEARIKADALDKFALRLWFRGINKTRVTFVPAYCFSKFGELPLELRLKIWNFALQAEVPQVHTVDNLAYDDFQSKFGSSIIVKWTRHSPTPSVLHACRESRKEVSKAFTCFRASVSDGHTSSTIDYFNTLHDTFHIGAGVRWDDFKILIQFTIELHTTCPFPLEAQKAMDAYRQIRYLIVDQTIFESVPLKVWTRFQNLDRLTIATLPYHDTLQEDDLEPFELCFATFITPHPRTKYGKRAIWIQDYVTKALEEMAKDEMPAWRVPEVRAAVKIIGDLSEENVHMIEPQFRQEYEREDGYIEEFFEGEEELEDDSQWLQAAKSRMKHSISPEHLERLTRKYHPNH